MVAIPKTFIDRRFQSLLLDLHDFKNRQYDLVFYNKILKESILDFASETPDNIACAQRIEFGRLGKNWGLKLKNPPALLSDLAETIINNTNLLTTIHSTFPDLTERDWQAAMSFVFLLLKDFEKPFGLAYRMKEVYVNGIYNRLDTNTLKNINEQSHRLCQSIAFRFPHVQVNELFEVLEFANYRNLDANIERYGIRVKNYVFISDILNILEESSAPDVFNSQQDWEAYNRFMAITLLAFEGNQEL